MKTFEPLNFHSKDSLMLSEFTIKGKKKQKNNQK